MESCSYAALMHHVDARTSSRETQATVTGVTGVNQLLGDQLTSELASQIANELSPPIKTISTACKKPKESKKYTPRGSGQRLPVPTYKMGPSDDISFQYGHTAAFSNQTLSTAAGCKIL